jgi:uncharacterized coiled-coil protein SlyX
VSRINASSSQLFRVARELRNIADEIVNGRNLFSRARSDTLIAWQSQMTGQFSESATATQNRIDLLANQVRMIASKVEAAGNAVRQAEREAARLSSR